MKRVYPVEDNCMGCKLCEVACVVEHSESHDILRAYKEEVTPVSRTRVEEKGGVSLSLNCRHCEEPSCVFACISGAMTKNDDGIVLVNEEKCIGCWMCLMSCQYGMIERKMINKTASKCDLCPDREKPACVEACPNRALVFEERN
ncbi:MAG: 4Fe-4S dicluster domain-containing protein [Nitrospinae bacterium]|nr:4Fe-4S dicluster domain-containing protein [Nitrospinota bacterium]